MTVREKSTERPTVSVCMATYNGARYLRQQMKSILPQLGPEDELIIVDDASTDETVTLIHGFQDSRIRLFVNQENLGAVKSFERALRLARGGLIFLSDQDDIWMPEKVGTMKEVFARSPQTALVVSDATVIDGKGDVLGSWYQRLPFRPSISATLVRNRYVGAFMAFRSTVRDAALPFPPRIPMHDVWIALVHHLVGETVSLKKPLLCYRRHEGTVTTGRHASVRRMAQWRINLLFNLVRRAISIYSASHPT